MKYKILGKSGLRVSELCLGTMTFGESWNWGTTTSLANEILKKFTDLGGNFIDTSNNYTDGKSEEIIGSFIKEDRDRYIVATKFTLQNKKYNDNLNMGGNHRKNLFRSVKESLKRLQTDFIDLLYLHMWDYTTPIDQIMKTLNDLVASGKVHHVAISDSPAYIASRGNAVAEYRGWSQFEAYQFPYSLVEREPEREVMPFSKEFGLTMTPWGILDAGLLSGKYTRKKNATGRLSEGKWGNPREEQLNYAREVDKVADELGYTSAQVAIAWVRQQASNIIPILGFSNPDQLMENYESFSITLPEEKVEQLNNVRDTGLGFPIDFLKSPGVINLIFGKDYDKLQF